MGKRCDPVLPDQGGRSMPIDPFNPISGSGEDLTRQRAYTIYEQRKGERGHELDHWLAAERELRTENVLFRRTNVVLQQIA